MLSVLLLTLPPFFLINSAHADADFNLMDIPIYLGEKFGVSTFIGGLIASLILQLIVLLPVGMLIKGKHTPIVITMIGMTLMGVTVALGWFPVYIFAVLTLVIALIFGRDIVKGIES